VPSNGPAAPPRPGSSQSIRPDSSMSSRGQSIPPVVVKKTRAPAKPRAEPAVKPRVRRKSPLNDTGAATAGNDGAGTVYPPPRSGSVSLTTNQPAGSQNSDIDSLTSGMKKINLSLVTKAQREAREQAKGGATKATASKPATRIIPKPKAVNRSSSISSQAGPVQLKPEPPAGGAIQAPEIPDSQGPESFPSMPSTPQQLPPHLPLHVQQAAAQVPLPASSPVPFAQPAATIQPTSSSDVFIPYQPEGPPPNPVPQQEAIRWLPPNTSTPTPMKRGDLPVFTATSAIPFGLNPAMAPPKPQEQAGLPAESLTPFDQSIWEVPETPKK
jgi:histone deacetylase HOS3